MYTGKLVFSQVMEHLPLHVFHQCVDRYNGNYKVKEFSCLEQYLCMAFAQLTYRESLRDIETCLRALRPKLYHAGLRGPIARSTLADANETRDWRIYADFAQGLIGRARRLYADLMASARSAGHQVLVCEVNSEPPNPASDAFHSALGFEPIGSAVLTGGAKSVRYLALRLDGGAH
jgi:hypothetical protein